MDDIQQGNDERPSERTDEDPTAEGASSTSDDDDRTRELAEKATDPGGDVASGGGEQPA